MLGRVRYSKKDLKIFKLQGKEKIKLLKKILL